MRDNGYNETHFKVLVVSEAFKPKVILVNLILLLHLHLHLAFRLSFRCPFKDTEWFTPSLMMNSRMGCTPLTL